MRKIKDKPNNINKLDMKIAATLQIKECKEKQRQERKECLISVDANTALRNKNEKSRKKIASEGSVLICGPAVSM